MGGFFLATSINIKTLGYNQDRRTRQPLKCRDVDVSQELDIFFLSWSESDWIKSNQFLS
jgi:hypothetical protein